MPTDRERHDRNRRLTIITGTIVILGAILAAIIIYSGGGGTTADPTERPPAHSVVHGSLVLGNPAERPQVVVTESLGSPQARTFEIASRDYLGRDAGHGLVSVRYVVRSPDRAHDAESAVYALVAQRAPDRLLCLHDALFVGATGVDAALRACGALSSMPRQFASGGIPTSPPPNPLRVVVDGRPLTGDPVSVAQQLETILASGAHQKGRG